MYALIYYMYTIYLFKNHYIDTVIYIYKTMVYTKHVVHILLYIYENYYIHNMCFAYTIIYIEIDHVYLL